jgi:hypothetical protein
MKCRSVQNRMSLNSLHSCRLSSFPALCYRLQGNPAVRNKASDRRTDIWPAPSKINVKHKTACQKLLTVSLSSVTRILKDYEYKRVGNEYGTPHKKRPRMKFDDRLKNFTLHKVSVVIYNRCYLYSTRLSSVAESVVSGKLDLGFKWRKSEDNKKVVIKKGWYS